MTNEYVRKQDALERFYDSISGVPASSVEHVSEYANKMMRRIQNLEPADVVPVIHGKWLPIVSYNNTYKCSECGRLLVNITDGLNVVAKHYPYCHCGAKMDGKNQKQKAAETIN